jgi:hypothetical protein
MGSLEHEQTSPDVPLREHAAPSAGGTEGQMLFPPGASNALVSQFLARMPSRRELRAAAPPPDPPRSPGPSRTLLQRARAAAVEEDEEYEELDPEAAEYLYQPGAERHRITFGHFAGDAIGELERRDAARREAQEKARKEAEERARKDAEEKARKDAEEKARKDAEEKTKAEAAAKAKEAEEKKRKAAEADAAKAKAEQAAIDTRLATELGAAWTSMSAAGRDTIVSESYTASRLAPAEQQSRLNALKLKIGKGTGAEKTEKARRKLDEELRDKAVALAKARVPAAAPVVPATPAPTPSVKPTRDEVDKLAEGPGKGCGTRRAIEHGLVELRHEGRPGESGTYRSKQEKDDKKGHQYGPFSRRFRVFLKNPTTNQWFAAKWVYHVHFRSTETPTQVDWIHAKLTKTELSHDHTQLSPELEALVRPMMLAAIRGTVDKTSDFAKEFK